MGCVATITAEKFPQQSDRVGTRVEVCFHYDTSARFDATVIRDDLETPWQMILQLEDGRVVLGSECQYSLFIPDGGT